MTNLDPSFCQAAGAARRKAGLAQSALARELGCHQSQLSMFEQGDGTKLNDEVIAKLCARFNLTLPTAGEAPPAAPLAVAPSGLGFCPNPHCPSNEAYLVGGVTFRRPNRAMADPVGARYCAVCGEVLERACPNCGARLHEGAVCSFCGMPYVVSP